MVGKSFKSPGDLRKWYEKNYKKETELLLLFYKTKSGKPSVTWPESVDQALCFGWIDGVRKSVDDESYTIRFTPRKPTSIWSAINIKKVAELKKQGLMKPEGLAAFEKKKEHKSKVYSFEQKDIAFETEQEKAFRKNKKAWTYFTKAAPSYRKAATWWVINAKQEATKLKRLKELIADSETGQHVKHLRRIVKK